MADDFSSQNLSPAQPHRVKQRKLQIIRHPPKKKLQIIKHPPCNQPTAADVYKIVFSLKFASQSFDLFITVIIELHDALHVIK